MILMTSRIIKMALLLALIAGGICFLKRKAGKNYKEKTPPVRFAPARIWPVLVVVFAIIANIAADAVPPLTDTVVLTALGEKNEHAGDVEVWLNGFTIDGKTLPPKTPTEGKWFWCGDTDLCWRSETDPRQPEGLTRSITVEIPVGWTRELNFNSCEWRGLVEIKTEQDTQVFDTYTEQSQIVPVEIGQSRSLMLIGNQVRMLAAYSAVLLLLAFIALRVLLWTISKPEEARAWLDKNWGKLVYGGIALFTFALMMHYAGRIQLRHDDLAQVGIANGTLAEAIDISWSGKEPTPVLTQILSTLWYRIAPYGERWLLLESVVFVTVAIYVLGLIGEQVKSKHAGVLAAAFCASVSEVWIGQAFEFRAYPYVMLFTTLTLYCFVKRNKEYHRIRWHVLYSLFLLCMGMTHVFGMLMCAAFFVGDVYLFSKRQIRWKTAFDYVVPGAICAAWEIHQLAVGLIGWINAFDGGWSTRPNVTTVITLLRSLSGGTEILYFALAIGLGIGLLEPIFKKGKSFEWRLFYQSFFSWTVVAVIAAMVFYGTVIKPDDAMFNTRYFLVLVPDIVVLMACTVNDVFDYCFKNVQMKSLYRTVGYVTLCAVLFSNCVSTVAQEGVWLTRVAADWIYSDVNYIFNDDTLVIEPWGDIFIDGWNDYYLTEQGKRDAINISDASISEEDLLQYKRVYATWALSWDTRLENLLNQYYDLVIDDTSAAVRVYNRKM